MPLLHQKLASGEKVSFIDGDWIESPYITDDGIRLVQTGNVGIGAYKEQGYRFVSEETFQELNCTEVFPNDVLICRLASPVGRACLAPELGVRMITSVDNCILKPSKFHDPRFIVYQLSNSRYLDYIEYVSRGSTRARISRSMLGDLGFVAPPLREQEAIADFLDCKTAQIDTLIEKKQRQIDLLHEQHDALINHAVTMGLNPDAPMKESGVEWLEEIPNHWTMTTVRYFYDVKLGKMLNSAKQNDGDIVKPYLRAANIHWNKVLLEEVGVNEMGFTEAQLERYSLQPGDLLVTEGGVTVGRSAIWSGELSECYYQNSLNRARPLKDITTKWLYYWMYFVTKNGYIDILADKSTFGHLTNEKLNALPIPIPSVSEHDEIISKLESYESKMEAQIALIEKQMTYLQEYRAVLISEAVTGKIDVR